MLKLGLQSYFLDIPVDDSAVPHCIWAENGFVHTITTFRARQDANAPEISLEARWRDWPLTFFCKTFPKIQNFPRFLQQQSRNVKIFVES